MSWWSTSPVFADLVLRDEGLGELLPACIR